MELAEAVACLSHGHAVLAEAVARQVCAVMGVLFPEHLVLRWQSREDAMRVYGLLPLADAPGSGVDSLALSYYLLAALGREAPGRAFVGRGFQARANVAALTRWLGVSEWPGGEGEGGGRVSGDQASLGA